jgi:integrase
MRLTDWLGTFCANHEYGISARTQAEYGYAIRSLARFLGRPPLLTDLADSAISAWIDHLRATRSPHTARTQRGSVLTLWRAAWLADLVPQPPRRVRRLRMPEPTPEAWTAEQVACLANLAGELPGRVRFRPIRTGPHLEAFIRVAWDTGFRLGDILALRPQDIASDGRIDIRQHKTGRRHVVRLWPDTVAAVANTLRDEPRERVFPLGRRWYQTRIRDLARQLGLSGSVKWLRRSVATAAEIEGGYGTRMLGHSDGRTLRWYLDRRAVEAVVAPRLVAREMARGRIPLRTHD